jgi:hypothetical protein
MFAEVLNDTQEYLLFVATGSSSTPDRVWVYNWGRRVWYPWTVSGPQCACLHRLDNTQTWDSISASWDSYPPIWDSNSLQTSYPGLLTGHTDGKVYLWNLYTLSDNGSPIRCYWTSKDLSAADLDPGFEGRQITLRGITVSYKATGAPFSVDFYYSTDGGDTWTGPYTEDIEAEVSGDKTFTQDFQVSGNTVRFRIEQNSATETLIINSLHPEIEIRDAFVR